MREYQQRNILRKLMYSKFTLLIVGLLCILMLRSVMELYGKYQKVSDLKDQSEKERISLEQKVDKARTKEEALQTDRGVEEYVRRTYPVVKEGEGVIVVYDASTSPVITVRKEMSFGERIQLMLASYFTK